MIIQSEAREPESLYHQIPIKDADPQTNDQRHYEPAWVREQRWFISIMLVYRLC